MRFQYLVLGLSWQFLLPTDLIPLNLKNQSLIHSELNEGNNNIKNPILDQPQKDNKADELVKKIDTKILDETNRVLENFN